MSKKGDCDPHANGFAMVFYLSLNTNFCKSTRDKPPCGRSSVKLFKSLLRGSTVQASIQVLSFQLDHFDVPSQFGMLLKKNELSAALLFHPTQSSTRRSVHRPSKTSYHQNIGSQWKGPKREDGSSSHLAVAGPKEGGGAGP